MADEKGKTVGELLCGYSVPLQQAELELYKTYRLMEARLNQQAKT